MSIIFDKKRFKRSYKLLKPGKEKYNLRISFYTALFYAVFMTGFNYLINEDKSIKSHVLTFFLYLIFMFFGNYLINKSQWSQVKREFNETVDYWEKNDPSFFEGEKYEKID